MGAKRPESLVCIYFACLSVCPFVSNKRQNGWTDRVKICCGTSRDPKEGLWMIEFSRFASNKIRFSKIFLKKSDLQRYLETFIWSIMWKIFSGENTWSNKAFKDTVVNRALPSLHRGSLEITLTVSLSLKINSIYLVCIPCRMLINERIPLQHYNLSYKLVNMLINVRIPLQHYNLSYKLVNMLKHANFSKFVPGAGIHMDNKRKKKDSRKL